MNKGREQTIEECGKWCACGHVAWDHEKRAGASGLGPYSTWFFFKCSRCRCGGLRPMQNPSDYE